MSGLDFLILSLPLIVAAMGTVAAYLHVRADEASRRAEAEAKRSKG